MACLGTVLAPVLRSPTSQALGRACSEAPMHLWGLWTGARGMAVHGPLVRDAPVGFPEHFHHHLIDPIHLLVVAPVVAVADSPAGAALAWNLVHGLSVVLGGLGCIALGRRLHLSGWPLALLVASVCGSPALLQHAELGRSEYLPALALPLILAWTRDAARHGAWNRGLAAGALLGAMLSSGPTLALFAGPFVVSVALVWSTALAWTRRLGVLGAVALPGLAGAALSVLALTWWPPPQDTAMLSGGGRELVHSVELATLVRLAPATRELELTFYLGLVALPLALVGVVRGPKHARLWAGATVILVLIGIGPYPTLFGALLAGPTLLLTKALPVLGAVSGWPRAAWVVAVPMGVCAALGLQVLGRRARWLGPVAVVALLVDHATYPAPRGAHRLGTAFAAAPPEAVAAVVSALPEGPLFTLPASTPASDQACAMDSPWVLWSAGLHRTVTANQGKPTDGLATGDGLAAGIVRTPERLLRQLHRVVVSDACAAQEVLRLHEAGIAAVVVDDTLPRGSATRGVLEKVLGPPHVEQGSVAGWAVQQWLDAHGGTDGDCAIRWTGGPR